MSIILPHPDAAVTVTAASTCTSFPSINLISDSLLGLTSSTIPKQLSSNALALDSNNGTNGNQIAVNMANAFSTADIRKRSFCAPSTPSTLTQLPLEQTQQLRSEMFSPIALTTPIRISPTCPTTNTGMNSNTLLSGFNALAMGNVSTPPNLPPFRPVSFSVGSNATTSTSSSTAAAAATTAGLLSQVQSSSNSTAASAKVPVLNQFCTNTSTTTTTTTSTTSPDISNFTSLISTQPYLFFETPNMEIRELEASEDDLYSVFTFIVPNKPIANKGGPGIIESENIGRRNECASEIQKNSEQMIKRSNNNNNSKAFKSMSDLNSISENIRVPKLTELIQQKQTKSSASTKSEQEKKKKQQYQSDGKINVDNTPLTIPTAQLTPGLSESSLLSLYSLSMNQFHHTIGLLNNTSRSNQIFSSNDISQLQSTMQIEDDSAAGVPAEVPIPAVEEEEEDQDDEEEDEDADNMDEEARLIMEIKEMQRKTAAGELTFEGGDLFDFCDDKLAGSGTETKQSRKKHGSKNKFDTKNLVKNFLNAFSSFVHNQDEESEILDVLALEDVNQLIDWRQNLRNFFKGKKFNRELLKEFIFEDTFRPLFLFFLENRALTWVQAGRMKDKASHLRALKNFNYICRNYDQIKSWRFRYNFVDN